MAEGDKRQGVYCPACDLRWDIEPGVRVPTVKEQRMLNQEVLNG